MDKGKATVIESDMRVREFLLSALRGFGFTSDYKPESFADQLKALLKSETDVIVFDLETPNIDGIEYIETIRNTRPNAVVIALVSAAKTAMGDLAVKKGATTFLTKPVRSEDLRKALQIAQLHLAEHQLPVIHETPEVPAIHSNFMKIDLISLLLLAMFSAFYLAKIPILGQPIFLLVGPVIGFILAVRTRPR